MINRITIVRKLLHLLKPYSPRERLLVLLLLIAGKLPFLKRTVARKKLYESLNIVSYVIGTGGIVQRSKKEIIAAFQQNNRAISIGLRLASSDFLVFQQIFITHEYAKLIELANANGIVIKTLVDGGANVGFASLYLNCFFPNLRIHVIEPAHDNFVQLKRNFALNAIENSAHFHQCALWYENTIVDLSSDFRDGREWSYSVNASGQSNTSNPGTGTKAITLTELIKANGIKQIDILKIDIEGAEYALFAKDKSLMSCWDRVKLLALEVHSAEHLPLISKQLIEAGFEIHMDKDTLFGVNRKFILTTFKALSL